MSLLQEIDGAKATAQDPTCLQGRTCFLVAVRFDHPKQLLAEGHVPEAAEVLLVDKGRAEAMQ